jgi:hypothetical protein
VVLLGLTLRLWAAWQLPVDFDEPVYLQAGYDYAQAIREGNINTLIDYPENREHPPLTKFLYGLTILGLGQGATWERALFLSRLTSVIFGVLSVLVMAVFDPLAGALFAVQTLIVKYTSQAYLEALPLFSSLVAVFALLKSNIKRDRWFWISAIALGLTAAGKFSYFPIFLVVLYIYLWEKRYSWKNLPLYLALATLFFLAFNFAIWRDPLTRLIDSVVYHPLYSQSADVLVADFPWYRPLILVARSMGFNWHPDVFFYYGIDGFIFLFAIGGLLREWRKRRWLVVWIVSNMLFLLLWPTKWPQYTLVVLPAFCLAASDTIKQVFAWGKEQETYWDWLENVLPKPSRRFIALIIGVFVLLSLAAIANTVYIGINNLGWSHIGVGISPLPSDTVNDMVVGPTDQLVIGTEGGAAIWAPAEEGDISDRWQVYTTDDSGLPDNRVHAVAWGVDEGTWFGTASGLAYLGDNEWTVFSTEETGLASDKVQALALDGVGGVWVGTDTGAARFDGQTWLQYTKDNSGLIDDTVFSLAVEQDGDGEKIWFGTLNGVSRYNPARDEWLSFSSDEVDVGWGGVSDLLIDTSGRLWMATLGGGISLWDGEDWAYLRTSNSEMPYNTVQKVYESEPGIFWIATSVPNRSGGLVSRFDGDAWQTFEPNITGYSGTETLVIAQDAAGRMWFGTRTEGIDVYQPRR